MGNVYTEPGSSSVHITDINNTRADLAANLDNCQLGIETDTGLLGYKDHLGTYRNPEGIRILSSAPSAVPNKIIQWMLDTDYASGNYMIRVVFPDGTDKGLYIPFSQL
jgi:hypothetical protein